MRKVVVVQSFDGHPIGSVVELSEKAAESAVIQRRGTILDDSETVASTPATEAVAPQQPKAKAKKAKA